MLSGGTCHMEKATFPLVKKKKILEDQNRSFSEKCMACDWQAWNEHTNSGHVCWFSVSMKSGCLGRVSVNTNSSPNRTTANMSCRIWLRPLCILHYARIHFTELWCHLPILRDVTRYCHAKQQSGFICFPWNPLPDNSTNPFLEMSVLETEEGKLHATEQSSFYNCVLSFYSGEWTRPS